MGIIAKHGIPGIPGFTESHLAGSGGRRGMLVGREVEQEQPVVVVVVVVGGVVVVVVVLTYGVKSLECSSRICRGSMMVF
jgi:hypothetical protein